MGTRIFLLSILLFFCSCQKFLRENPNGFLDADQYYKTPEQAKAAVNGTYEGLGKIFTVDLGVSVSAVFALEYITGYSNRPRPSGFEDDQFLRLDKIDPANSRLQAWWSAYYKAIENCNSVIENINNTKVLDTATSRQYLGQVYFLRAWYYFQLVRLFGDVPLKTTPTKDLNNIFIPKTPMAQVYEQVVKDLDMAAASNLPWTDQSGRVSLGAVKSLLAKVYITMAGYPLQKGKEYYIKAYEAAMEVINSGRFELFDDYSELRDVAKQNTKEHIFMLQRHPTEAASIIHFGYLPYPDQPISIQPAYGGAMAPEQSFYDSYPAADKRKAEQAFFYTRYPNYSNPNSIVQLPAPFIFKFWDALAEQTGRSGENFPLIRYADVLLLCAEARAMADGGSTADAAAIGAYCLVRQRAMPGEQRPAVLEVDQVLKERYLELCFEFQTWFDMLRTRKALDVPSGQMVPLLGYKAPRHIKAFTEADLKFPVPLAEIQKNPALKD